MSKLGLKICLKDPPERIMHFLEVAKLTVSPLF